jgi:hypothetical protein
MTVGPLDQNVMIANCRSGAYAKPKRRVTEEFAVSANQARSVSSSGVTDSTSVLRVHLPVCKRTLNDGSRSMPSLVTSVNATSAS